MSATGKKSIGAILLHSYGIWFLVYLMLPLLVMVGAAFNNSPKLPSPLPWQGFTLRFFPDLFAIESLWGWNGGVMHTIIVAIFVVVLAVPIGTAGAILINNLQGRSRVILYAVMIAPVLTPGVVIGIATLQFWFSFDVPAGLHLSALGQVSFIAAYVMLMVLARLQSFDPGLEEAALDLGATHGRVLRRILMPHLAPALITGAILAFFQSVENFNVTQFTRGQSQTLMVYFGSRGRSGVSPTICALAVILIAMTIVGEIIFEIWRRRAEAKRQAVV
jgi:spermidine/putrescine transport system permease protein